MLVVAGTIEIDPAKLPEAREAAVAMMAETRKEPGNISYAFSTSLENDGVVYVFEEWESQQALDLHFASPHMAAFQQQMGGFGIAGMRIQKYEVSKVGPLG